MAAAAITEKPEILKPRNDKRDYRSILLQNNLQVLLISDPETDKASPISSSNIKELIEMKLEKHKNLREESGVYWREVSDGTLKFDRREREVEALKQLSHKELIEFFNEYIKFGAPQKKRIWKHTFFRVRTRHLPNW